MSKLSAVFGVKAVAGAKVGLEIECEGKRLEEVFTDYWTSTNDGSLRGRYPEECIEYVFKNPLTYQQTLEALKEIEHRLRNAEVHDSFRTSVHVHVNVSDMTETQFYAFIYSYFLLERTLMKYCGEDRNNNRFALRAVDCDYLIYVVERLAVNGIHHIGQYISNELRYGAANMASLLKYGTLEFRGMRGTIDKEVLKNWTRVLLNLRAYAIQAGNPWKVFTEATESPEEFCKQALGDKFDVFYNEDTLNHLTEGLSLCVTIPFSWKERNRKLDDLERRAKEIKKQAEVARDFVAPLPAQARPFHEILAAAADRARAPHVNRLAAEIEDRIRQERQLQRQLEEAEIELENRRGDDIGLDF